MSARDPKAVTTPDDAPATGWQKAWRETVERRLDTLETRIAMLTRHVEDMAENFDAMWKEARATRQRLASFYPERHYCPYCKATVHKDATSCRSCGKSWGSIPDPKAGLPR